MTTNESEAFARFVRWLDARVIADARGDLVTTMEKEPRNKLWLGRLASETAVANTHLGGRGERLDPCATGLRVTPASTAGVRFKVKVRCCAWLRQPDKTTWRKSAPIAEIVDVAIEEYGIATHGAEQLAAALATVAGKPGLKCVVRTELERTLDGRDELTILLVNTSPDEHDYFHDTNLYECVIEAIRLARVPYLLEGLPDSFRYDRRVEAYGVNGGYEVDGAVLRTTDTVVVDRGRPRYWNRTGPVPDFRFDTLASEPLRPLTSLVHALETWGRDAWSESHLTSRSGDEHWTLEMQDEATRAAAEFESEVRRVKVGLDLLCRNEQLRRAFMGMNAALRHSSRGKYDGWRPFQIGFLLANLSCLVDPSESDTADVVWFATGGGKTETYLGLVVTAALLDRMKGKASGITAWSRFPLRMLSLQQTQRFADAMAGAELVRRQMGLAGDPFSVGFLVGQGATPNSIKLEPSQHEPDPDDPQMPAKFRVLLRCPFCGSEALTMGFDRRLWRLEHRCGAEGCAWKEHGLPFYVVDDELYRFLPTIVVGTLDKAASIALQPSMRGLVGPPWAVCSVAGHGFTYAPRKNRPNGCLVPECPGRTVPLSQERRTFPPALRLQDELHLLKDSLGAVDAHYEAIFDHLQRELTGTRAKVLGSSATLTGYEKQVDVLYARRGRVFPVPGPRSDEGFWTTESTELARRFVALAPRGATIEYAVDQTTTSLQVAIRDLIARPVETCEEIGVDPSLAPRLVELYGVDVVYGNTLRDLEAVTRSFETQIRVSGPLEQASLTGRTPFEEVRQTLDRLERPEANYFDRLHIIAASSMMSHGVDIDRLNVLTMIGMPLTTAEFIQISARVGRRYPGIVFVMLKMARERDAGVFRSFASFVKQGDRFVEPVPITKRSRRVLEHTLSGMFFARIRQIHEPSTTKALTTAVALRDFRRAGHLDIEVEYEALTSALGLTTAMDEQMRADIRRWLEEFFEALDRVDGANKWPQELSPTGEPMISLRDVEEQAPVYGTVRS
jgi:hypothetical protein